MSWLIQNWDQVIRLILEVIGAAAIVAAWTPTPKDDEFLAMVRKIINTIGFNVKNAKNKDDGNNASP